MAIAVEPQSLKVYKPSMRDLKINLMVYGPPGAGKTTLAGTAQEVPEMSPAIFGSIEAGEMALAEMENPPDIYPFGGDIERLEKLYWFLRNEDHGYKTVVLDSLSELQRLHRESLVAARHQAGRRESIFDTQQKDWGDNMSYLLYWVRRFRDLPLHVIVCCHSETRQKPDGGERIQPLLNKALVEPMCGVFDIVGYLFTANEDPENGDSTVIRKLLTEPLMVNGIEFVAKDRSPGGKLGRVMKDPTLPRIYQRLLRSKSDQKAPKKAAKAA